MVSRGDSAIFKISVLASSSNGNCALVATDRTRLLIDAGLSRKETFERMAAAGEDPESLDAILITHEHSDHTAGLQAIARKLDIPVYLSRLTAPCVAWNEFTPKLELFQAGASFTIGDIDVSSFTIPHDAADPVGFAFQAHGIRIAIATDLGYLPDSIRFHLSTADVLLLESNHDLEMLKVGPYPWSVKQRVMGRMGHLSNEVACRFIRDHIDSSTSTIILGHLSEHNNHPAIVENCAERALGGRSLFTRLIVADPRRATESVVYG
jgi:phosphoribosyl 1,2-cyclic phosphodiesterase